MKSTNMNKKKPPRAASRPRENQASSMAGARKGAATPKAGARGSILAQKKSGAASSTNRQRVSIVLGQPAKDAASPTGKAGPDSTQLWLSEQEGASQNLDPELVADGNKA